MAHYISQATQVSYPKWKQDYHAALLETDRTQLKSKIQKAEAALFARTLERNRPPDHAERQAMEHAAYRLRAVLVDVLGYPDHGKA